MARLNDQAYNLLNLNITLLEYCKFDLQRYRSVTTSTPHQPMSGDIMNGTALPYNNGTGEVIVLRNTLP